MQKKRKNRIRRNMIFLMRIKETDIYILIERKNSLMKSITREKDQIKRDDSRFFERMR
jgi:hypothetical protein